MNQTRIAYFLMAVVLLCVALLGLQNVLNLPGETASFLRDGLVLPALAALLTAWRSGSSSEP